MFSNFTPVFAYSDGGITVSYLIQDGRYTRIGNLVIALIRLASDGPMSHANFGDVQIQNLPHNIAANQQGACGMFRGRNLAGWNSFGHIGAYGDAGNNFLILRGNMLTTLTATDVPSGSSFDIDITVIYETDEA